MPGWLFRCYFICMLCMFSSVLNASPTSSFKILMQTGKQQYNQICAACHQPDGSGQPLDAPPLKHGLVASSFITTDKPIATHIATVLTGVPGTNMLSFSYLSDQQIAAIITYERNAWGNETHDVITAEDVQRERKHLLVKQNMDLRDRTRQELMLLGRTTYRTYCARCHQLSGAGAAPNGPSLLTSSVSKEPDLMPYRLQILLHGAAGTRMRGYAAQLNDLQLAAVATYIGNAWSASSLMIVQPKDIQLAKEKLRQKLATPAAVIDKARTLDELLKLGKYVYLTNCVRCHLNEGQGGGQTGVPSLRNSKIVTATDINKHIDIILTGVPSSIMRAFGPRLDNAEIAAVATYERNAFANHTGEMIQPSDVKREREKLSAVIEYQRQHQLIQQYEFEQKQAVKRGV